MKRDSIDFAHEPVAQLFRHMFFPTLVGMVSMVVLNITDGAFVGHGVGSDALAAVNIIAPVFMLLAGIGLMFGIGSSVAASIHLSHGKVKAAQIHITQSLLGGVWVGILAGGLMLLLPEQTCHLFGATDRLMPLAKNYLFWIAMTMPLCILSEIGMFIIRLDGSPRVASTLNVIMAGLNIFLDWLCVFPLHMGLSGAALATSASYATSGICTLVYVMRFSHTLHLYRLKVSQKSLMLTLRNLGYQVRIGFSALLGEMAMALLFVVGNYQFIKYLGEDGVAAFSVGCYCLPICFMLGNAIVQSSQPIISFAHGQGNKARVSKSLRIALVTSLISGLLGMSFIGLGSKWISSVFLPYECPAWQICMAGLPHFSISFLVVCISVVLIGYFQSIEQATTATVFTILRGFVYLVSSFYLLPSILGTVGLWYALFTAESLNILSIIIYIWVQNLHHTRAPILKFLRENALFVAMAIGALGYWTFRQIACLQPICDVAAPWLPRWLPYGLFILLYVTFCKIRISELKPRKWHFVIQGIRTLLSALMVGLIILFGIKGPEVKLVLEGMFICFICPTAAAVVVVCEKLGGSIGSLTIFTIIANLFTMIIIPFFFPMVERGADITYLGMMLMVLRNVTIVLVGPLALAMLSRRFLPRWVQWLGQYHNLGFYVWCFNLIIITGITLRNICHSTVSGWTLLLLLIAPLGVCLLQFTLGKLVGHHYNDSVSAGQALGQKNTVVGIWLTLTFLNPLAAVSPGAYVLWQNMVNGWQIWYHEKHGKLLF